MSVLFAALLSPIWSGCPTSAPGSSSAAPSPVPTASRRWSLQSCSKHGARNCSSLISGSGLRRAQQVLDSTALDQPTRFQGDLHWRCSSVVRDNDIADPLASLQPEHLWQWCLVRRQKSVATLFVIQNLLHHGVLHPVLKGLAVLLRGNRIGSCSQQVCRDLPCFWVGEEQETQSNPYKDLQRDTASCSAMIRRIVESASPVCSLIDL